MKVVKIDEFHLGFELNFGHKSSNPKKFKFLPTILSSILTRIEEFQIVVQKYFNVFTFLPLTKQSN